MFKLFVLSIINCLFLFDAHAESSRNIPAIEIPFHNLNGYIMIDGHVDTTHGLFMFDTGTQFSYLLNNNILPLSKDEFFASGHAGSGQPVVIFKKRSSTYVNLFYGAIEEMQGDILHADFDFIQKGLACNFIGMVGIMDLKERVFSINYQEQLIKVYDKLPEMGDGYIKILVNNNPLPELNITVGGVNITAYFDTGNIGSLFLTLESEEQLKKAGLLTSKVLNGNHGSPGRIIMGRLSEVKLNDSLYTEVDGLTFENGESNRLGLGFSFLKRYESIWDLKNGAIYLLMK
ncbi:hypothetical protein JD488_10030 [Aeromonas jandaei]|uniref:hypothetical protein n=1 Tax=Aeromonas jandaei TaxID=650 RepID=UPI00191CAB0D|nr:hypothetical protein [Aeromonas jandaei]MBL0667045.1 hypothetical protein [Aeromonas jandaei]